MTEKHPAMHVIEDAKSVLEAFATVPTSEYSFLAERYRTGRTFFTGIGKCSFLAMKQVTTLKSIQYEAEYLAAIDAMHGDLGAIPNEDNITLVAISKSGLSDELYLLFDAVLRFRPKVQIVLICMPNERQKQSVHTRLTKLHSAANSDTFGYAPVPTVIALPSSNVKEIDGYGIIPSVSNALFEIFISMTVAPLTYHNADALERIKQAHPGGALQAKVTNLLSEHHVTSDN